MSNQTNIINNFEKFGSKPYYLVLDFEANCSGDNKKDHEIIEFPAILVDSKTGQSIGEFREFVKVHSGKKLSEFIKGLTHITDEQVSNGLTFLQCLIQFEVWCHANQISWKSTTIVTVGEWDLRIMLDKQLRITKIKLNKFLNDLFGCWTNIKIPFAIYTKTKAKGMVGMLNYFDLELTGQQHSGIDDCRNTIKICNALINLGCDVTTPTTFRTMRFWYYEHILPYKFMEDDVIKC